MSSDRAGSRMDDPLARARSIHRSCEAFEAAWRAGHPLEIAEILAAAPAAGHDELFRELLGLEIELLREQNEAPALEQYLARFADRETIVRDVFAESSATQVPAADLVRLSPDAATLACPPRGRAHPEVVAHGTIGDYELIEELARGGMGVVYKARHQGLKRVVALKMILSGSLATFEERQRFLREAELAANLDHPNIVPIYEVDEHDDRPFFSMKLVDGGSLARGSARFRNDFQAIARLLSIIARAVHHAHGQGFLHCDLKPSNVLLDARGNPYVTDFGLARRAGVDSSLSMSGAILGTPSYMAPEQAAGSRTGLVPATDVYGLGAILYELLTGRPPFRSPTVMETVVQVLERDPAPPRDVNPDVPRELESICLKCLEKSPKDRYASAEDLAQELDHFLGGEGIEAAGIFSRLRRWNRREPELVARLGGVGLMAILTQINYHVSTEHIRRLHWTIEGVLALCALASVLFQMLLRAGARPDRVRILWSATDIACVTCVIKLLESIGPDRDGTLVVHVESTILVAYPLLIAASGLWWRVELVWLTTAMAAIAFGGLYLDSALWWSAGRLELRSSPDLIHPNIFLAGLVLTGYVVVRQIKRILALGRYYEHRSER